MNVERAHQIARERGPIMPLYWIVRAILQPAAMIYMRLRRIGREYLPAHGAVLLAANHRSFSDPFFIGMCLGRPLRFVAKIELFDKPWKAWILLALGAFPIKRGESDEQAMETARLILEQGGAVGIFPEGTRVRPGPLGQPKRGLGRLALETGAPIVPVAICGTDDIRRGWFVRPRKVSIRLGRALTFPRPLDGASPMLAAEITDRVWSCVSLQWEWLGGDVPSRRVVVVGAGSWGTALATLFARGGASVQFVCRTREQCQTISRSRRNVHYLPGVELPQGVHVTTLDRVAWSGVDVLCLAVPSGALHSTLVSVRSSLPADAGIALTSKGLVGTEGLLPSVVAGELVPERPIVHLGGPAHALEAVRGNAELVLGTNDRGFAARVTACLRAAGVRSTVDVDLVGVQLAGVAKNAASFAAGAALDAGANAAGAAAGRVYGECARLAVELGADPETFSGVAGAGDLVATVISTASRNRRAGELLSSGADPAEVRSMLGQLPEAIEMLPGLARAARHAHARAPEIERLTRLVDGRMTGGEWLERAKLTTPVRAA